MKPLVVSGLSSAHTKRALSGQCSVPSQPVSPCHASTSRSVPRNLDNLDLASSRSPLAPLPLTRPKNAEELFKPLSHASSDLPEWVQGYLSLLAESSTSNGSIQRMLIHLIARGAADTAKLAHVIADPVDGMVDVLADKGTQMVMRHMGPALVASSSSASETGLTEPSPADPAQGKMLSILLSLMLSGLASGVASDAVKMGGADLDLLGHHAHLGARTEVVHTATTAADDATDFFRLDSMRARVGPSFMARAAPSLTSGLSTSGASVLGAGGIATSTALKMLRADSKLRSPDLGNVLGAILDTVSESTSSMDWEEKKPTLAAVGSHMGQRQAASRLGESMVGQGVSHLGEGIVSHGSRQ